MAGSAGSVRPFGLCERAPAALITAAGEASRIASAAPVDAAGILARLDGDGTPRRPAPIPQAGIHRSDSAPRPRHRPDIARRLPRTGRIRRARPRPGDRPGGRHRRGHRVEVDGSRWCGLSDRSQWPRWPVRPRVRTISCAMPTSRAGHLQGPGAAGGRPVRDRRGCRRSPRSRRGRPGLPVYPRRVSGGRGGVRGAIAAAREANLLGPDILGSGFDSTSRSGAGPAPTSAARRRRSSSRSKANAVERATSRRSRSNTVSSASRPWSTTSRRWPTSRWSWRWW